MADEIVLHVTEAKYEDTVVKSAKPVLLAMALLGALTASESNRCSWNMLRSTMTRFSLPTVISIPKQVSTLNSVSATSRRFF